MTAPSEPASDRTGRSRQTGEIASDSGGQRLGLLPFRILIMVGLVGAAVIPVLAFGAIVLAAGWDSDESAFGTLLALAVVVAALFGLAVATLTTSSLTSSLRRITGAIEEVAAGETSPPIHIAGDDELARLAESHNRIAADRQRRNAELAGLLSAIGTYEASLGVDGLRLRAEQDARTVYGMIDSQLTLGDPRLIPREERVPGDPFPVRAEVRAGTETLGVLTGHLPATRKWERADQDLLELFASEMGAALRNAELFHRIESQNERLRELDATKDEFLRGVSHNLQTPLTSIRAYVEQLRDSAMDTDTDRRLGIVAEQASRLTRLVRQLLTVTRLEAGVLRAEPEIINICNRIRRAWEGLNAAAATMELHDESNGWLAVADPDQLDQVLWALLDNAVKYGGETGRVLVSVAVDETIERLHVTIVDSGPGIDEQDRDRLFTRFTRGSNQGGGDGTGLGLYLSRELLRAMGGEIWLEPAEAGRGAAFTISLPGEPPADES